MSSKSDSRIQPEDSRPEPTQPEPLDAVGRYRWVPRYRTFTVIGPNGVYEEHTGLRLTLRDVIKHLCRSNWPPAYEYEDTIVFREHRALAMVSYPQRGQIPVAVLLWDDEDGRERIGQTVPYNEAGHDPAIDD